jgi:hypothetical protein
VTVMEQMKRYAIYYLPESGAFAQAAGAWLGWDLARGQAVAQPQYDLPRPLAMITAAPRKYGFHGTIKPPFRLIDGACFADLAAATKQLAERLRPVNCAALKIVEIGSFLALVPQGDTADLQDLAAEIVRGLDPLRAALTDAEVAKRRPDRLSPRQRELLEDYGYPFVMEEFKFHLTLSGRLAVGESEAISAAATFPACFHSHFLCNRSACVARIIWGAFICCTAMRPAPEAGRRSPALACQCFAHR